MVDIPGNSTTTRSISVGGSVTDSLEIVGDHDWFKIQLTAGQSISVSLDGLTLIDPYLRIRDSSGNIIFENDDITSGINRDSLLGFTATYTGTYYIDVGAWDPPPDSPDYPGYTGTYRLSVETYTPPPVGTVEDLADYLVDGYWSGESRHFNVSPGGSITVNVTALTAPAQTLALAALATWTDIIGVTFVQVATGGQITFDDNQEGAFSNSIWSNGVITNSHVNVSIDWLADYGTALNGYSFQTYVHEIGHALGLGHQGGYNGDANYPFDAVFLNDGWPLSVMSYFDQIDNTYFAGQGFDFNYVVTPMMADILAMSMLYGLSTTTRVGNTTYGPGWSSAMGALCIFDSGGIDTIDVSGLAGAHLINLTPGTFSSVMNEVGNVSIALGVIIENAIASDGSELIIGNSANNVLDGRAGIDTVSYESATAGVTVDLSITGPQNTVGAGVDTLLNFENLTGSRFNDVLTSRGGSTVNAGDGDDIIRGPGHLLNGQAGNDTFVAGDYLGIVDGGQGWDRVDFSQSTTGIQVDLSNQGPNSHGLFYNVEEAIGSGFSDRLTGSESVNIISGGTGNDTISGVLGADTLTGGAGNDIFKDTASGLSGDTITDFAAGDSIVISNASLESFNFSLNGDTLTYTGGSLTLTGFNGQLQASAVAGGGGVQLTVAPSQQFSNPSLVLTSFGTGVGGWSTDDRYPRVLADVNGDNRADIVGFGNDGVYVSLGQANGTFSNPTAATSAFGYNASAGGWSSNDRYPRVIGDVNGDNRADIIGFGNDGVYVSLGQANGTFSNPTAATSAFGYNASAGGWSSNDRYPRVIGDVNGDNRADIIGFGNDGVYVSLGQANGTFSNPTAATSAFGYNPSAGGWSSNNIYPRMVGDVNNDGRTDIIGFGNHGAYVSLGQPNGTFAPPTLALHEFGAQPAGGDWISYDRYPRELADVNGDDRLDIVGFGNDGVFIAYGNGDGTFQASILDLDFFGFGPQAGNWTSEDVYPRRLADVNGDGAADIVGFYVDGVHVALSNGAYLV